MRFLKNIGLLFVFSLFALQSGYAQTQKKTNVKKATTTVKAVPAATKNKTALKKMSKQTTTARKQQIKKAVRRSNMTKRKIRKR